jgi:polyisoprenoid-binding protein YceI
MKSIVITILVLTSASLVRAETANYNADPTHTFVTFEAKHFGTSTVRGRFDKKEGGVSIDWIAKTGKAEFTIDTTSISTGVPALDSRLKARDLFNAAEISTAKFVGDKFGFDGRKVTSVAGELTLLGKTLPVTLTAVDFNCYENSLLKREVCGGDFETTIARSQWGMSFGTHIFPDSIHLLIQVEAIKQ